MGWMSWTKFYCQIDCVKYVNACINADLYMSQADRMGKKLLESVSDPAGAMSPSEMCEELKNSASHISK